MNSATKSSLNFCNHAMHRRRAGGKSLTTCTIHSLFRGVCAINIGEEEQKEKKNHILKQQTKYRKKQIRNQKGMWKFYQD